jgi:hypothetical protein
MPNGLYGGVRGRGLIAPSYSILKTCLVHLQQLQGLYYAALLHMWKLADQSCAAYRKNKIHEMPGMW